MEEITDRQKQEAKSLVNQIYTDIFRKIDEQYIIVFLCGGASDKDRKSLRDQVRKLLEHEKGRIASRLPIKVFYPEDLFMDMLNTRKDSDLLSCEQLLAENSHLIAIICESAGALVELGAFTNNEYTVSKVIAAVDRKKARNKSFIMLGPVRYLKKIDKQNVIEYDAAGGEDQTKKFVRELSKNIRKKYSNMKTGKEITLNTIVGMHYFIMILLYFFKKLRPKELAEYISGVSENNQVITDSQNFSKIFNAALKLLYHDQYIVKKSGPEIGEYALTDSGYRTIEKMIVGCTSRELCDKIRIKVMYWQFYKSPRS